MLLLFDTNLFVLKDYISSRFFLHLFVLSVYNALLNSLNSDLAKMQKELDDSIDRRSTCEKTRIYLISQKNELISGINAFDESSKVSISLECCCEIGSKNLLETCVTPVISDLKVCAPNNSYEATLSSLREKQEDAFTKINKLEKKISYHRISEKESLEKILEQKQTWKVRYEQCLKSGDPLKLSSDCLRRYICLNDFQSGYGKDVVICDVIQKSATISEILFFLITSSLEIEKNYEFASSFLMLRSKYIDSKSMLLILVHYYRNPPSANVFVKDYICNLIELWIENYPEDFTEEKEIYELIHFFTLLCAQPEHCNTICKLLTENVVKNSFISKEYDPAENKKIKIDLAFFSLAPVDLAHMISVEEMKLFVLVSKNELLNYNQQNISPHINDLFKHTKLVKEVFSKMVSSAKGLEKCEKMHLLYLTAKECFRIGNFNTFITIMSVISESRLSEDELLNHIFLEEYLGQEEQEEYTQLIERSNPANSTQFYHEYWNAITPPAIPHFEVFFKDLQDFLTKHPLCTNGVHQLINIDEVISTANFIKKIKEFQVPYPYPDFSKEVCNWFDLAK